MRTIASTGYTFAIAILLAATGCGEVDNFTDAGSGDDEIDADTTPPDAIPTGPVTVNAANFCCTLPSGPVLGADVVAIHPDGTVGDTAQTDASGNATVDVTAGDSVTVIYFNFNSGHRLTTFLGVEPGDNLQASDGYLPGPPAGVDRTMTVTLPAAGGASSFTLYSSCTSTAVAVGATTAVVPQYSYCNNPTENLVLVGTDATGQPNRWSVMNSVAFVANTTVGPMPAVQPTASFQLAASGLPATLNSYQVYTYAGVPGTYVGALNGYLGNAPVNGAVSGSVPWGPVGIGTVVQTYASRPNFASQSSQERLANNVMSWTRPADSFLPWVSNEIAINSTVGVTWIQSGDEAYDGALVQLNWYRNPPLFGGNPNQYQWKIIVPPGITSLEFPPLPAQLAAHAPIATDNINGGVTLVESDAVADYAAFRAAPHWLMSCPGCMDSGATNYPRLRTSGNSGAQ